MEVIYRKPTLRDVDMMQDLVKSEVDKGVILYRSADEMAGTIRSYFVALVDSKIVGFAALHIHNTKLAEIRSLIVDERYRGQKIGVNLVKNAISEGMFLGVQEILVLTYRAEFFKALGFVEIPKESIPESKIWADCIKCKHFPICDEVSLIINL